MERSHLRVNSNNNNIKTNFSSQSSFNQRKKYKGSGNQNHTVWAESSENSTAVILFENNQNSSSAAGHHFDIIRRLKKEKKQRQKKQKQRQELQRQRVLKQNSMFQRKHQQEQAEKSMQRQQWRNDLKERLIKQKEDRSKSVKEWQENQKKRKITQKHQQSPLYKRLEQNYKSQILNPEIERQRSELAKIRQFYKPLSKAELIQHEKRHQDMLRLHMVEQEKARHEKKLKQEAYDPGKYATRFTYNLLAQKQLDLQQEEKKSMMKRQLYDKKMEYGKLVKETRTPTISEKKRLELKMLMDNIKHPVRRPSPLINKSTYSHSTYSLYQKKNGIQNNQLVSALKSQSGLNDPHLVDGVGKHIAQHASTNDSGTNSSRNDKLAIYTTNHGKKYQTQLPSSVKRDNKNRILSLKQGRGLPSEIDSGVYSRKNINLPSLNGATSFSNIKHSTKNSMTPQNYSIATTGINQKLKIDKSVDYLLQMRNKRETSKQSGQQRSQIVMNNWRNDLNDEKLSSEEKFQRVSEKARRLQTEAKRKEQLLQVQNNKDVQETSQVTDMLVDAIKAKLAILEGI